MSLPDDYQIFSGYFDQWYNDRQRQRREFTHTRPDMIRSYGVQLSGSELSPLLPEGQTKALGMIQTMYDSTRGSWADIFDLEDDLPETWIQAFDDYYDADTVQEVIDRSDPNDFSNELVVLICQLGAVLGDFFIRCQPRLQWIPDLPYWESSLYDRASGYVIPPFHWAIKKFSAYGIDDGCLPKALKCIEILNEHKDETAHK